MRLFCDIYCMQLAKHYPIFKSEIARLVTFVYKPQNLAVEILQSKLFLAVYFWNKAVKIALNYFLLAF